MGTDDLVPSAFDVYTLVVLRRPDSAPPMSEEDLDALQVRHLTYRADLRARGLTVANGPMRLQSDDSYRGMTIFTCDPQEATRLSEADPSVIAGRLTFDVMEWWVPADSLAFPTASGPVGRREKLTD